MATQLQNVSVFPNGDKSSTYFSNRDKILNLFANEWEWGPIGSVTRECVLFQFYLNWTEYKFISRLGHVSTYPLSVKLHRQLQKRNS